MVVAPEKRLVLWVEDSFGEGGCNERFGKKANVVVLQTTLGTQITFVHLKQGSAKVKVGDVVEQGQELAVSGDSGFSCGEHLHFEFQKACRDLKQAKQLRTQFTPGKPTLAWSCPTKPYYSDGFYIGDRYYERLTIFPSYTSDNR